METEVQAHSSRGEAYKPDSDEEESCYSLIRPSRQRHEKKIQRALEKSHDMGQSKGKQNNVIEMDQIATQASTGKSIIKGGKQANPKRMSVKFKLPQKSPRESRRPRKHGCFQRCMRFLVKPVGRAITSIVCCVVLPCIMIYASVFISTKLRSIGVVTIKGKLAS